MPARCAGFTIVPQCQFAGGGCDQDSVLVKVLRQPVEFSNRDTGDEELHFTPVTIKSSAYRWQAVLWSKLEQLLTE